MQRIGYGTMRLPGKDVWGEPDEPARARRVLRRALELGGKRLPDKSWAPALRPEELRMGAEEDLRTLRLERLDVVHLRHMPAAGIPLRESLDALFLLQADGTSRHLALSNVNAREIDQALARTPIVAVQNLFNVSGGGGAIVKHAHSEFPLWTWGELANLTQNEV